VKTVMRERRATQSKRQPTFFTRQYAVALAGVCFSTVAVTHYNESKVSQCNRLVAIVNQAADAQPDALGLTMAEDNHRLMKTAIQLEGYADRLAFTDFSDPQVQVFQSQFVQLYRDISRASSAVVTAPTDNFQIVSQVNRSFIETQERESPLVQKVNQYCNAR
jgi:oligoendopeptidase F